MHAAPTAWDYVFGRMEGYYWVNIELRDGRRIFGIFGPDSFATTGADGNDLYVEELTGEGYKRLDRKAGLWIRRSEVAFIEIIHDQA